jgi:hypothetical protein
MVYLIVKRDDFNCEAGTNSITESEKKTLVKRHKINFIFFPAIHCFTTYYRYKNPILYY